MSKWEKVKLGDVCTINPPKKLTQDLYEKIDEVSFVSMSDVSEDGQIFTGNKVSYSEVSSGYSYFIEDDILFAKITPCMENGKGAIARKLVNGLGVGSTEFHVLRPNKNLVISDWVFRFLSQSKFRKSAEKNMTGSAGQKRVPKTFLETALIPLPPLETQKQIAKTLDTAAELLAMRKQQLAELDNLIKAVFYEMFGDPVTNERGWEVNKLSKIGDLNRGISKHRPRNDPALLGGLHPLIQTGDVANADFIIRDWKQTYSDLGLAQSKKWSAGTLCITIAANIAKTAIMGFDACFPDSVVGFNANKNKTNNIFIHCWFGFFQKIIEAQAPESAQKNINLRILSDLDVIVPPLELQTQFATIVTKIEAQKSLVKKAIEETQYLFDSLMAQYFE